jgi:hypothetical protein
MYGESGEDPANMAAVTNTVTGSSGAVTLGHPWSGYKVDGVGNDNLDDGLLAGEIHNNLVVSWDDSFKSVDSTPGDITYTSAVPIRCDAQANVNGYPGCSIAGYTPELVLTGYDSGNSATASVYGFQYYNVDHWGQYPNGRKLSRLNNPTQANKNRYYMCQNGTWTKNSTVPNDSCDEFPFAGTYQSGKLLGLKASQCAQWIPKFNSTNHTWTLVEYPGYSTSERCVLGHVALTYNTADGTMYSNFIQANRLLDRDTFWIGIGA